MFIVITVFFPKELSSTVINNIIRIALNTYGANDAIASEELNAIGFGFTNEQDATDFYNLINEVYKLKVKKVRLR